MRLKLILSGVMVAPALLLAGCGMTTTSSFSANVMSPAVSGRAYGGQQPISGATISVVAMGTSGYGSAGTVLASTTTDSLGNFSFAPGAYSCPQDNTPVYLLGAGGDSGAGNNPSIMTAAGLGTCTAGKSSYTVMNEVTTAALAYALSHFFTPTLGGSGTINGDWFGGPSTTSGGTTTYSAGLVMGNSYTIPAMVSNAVGAPNQPNATSTVDAAKINSIANSLAACINSNGGTSTTDPCGKLFLYTTPPGGTTAPTDTLQAAVQMALYPYQNVTQIYNLATQQAPFAGLTTAPHDWTVSVSYTSPNLGLSVDAGAVSTLDIDAQGKVWFPSNASGAVGAAYFDPTSRTFNGPYNSTGLAHPLQVAIDGNGYAWYNDTQNYTVPGYNTLAPATTQSFTLANAVSNAVTIGDDNRVNVGIDNQSIWGIANISADRSSYTLESGVSFQDPVISMSGDAVGGDAITAGDFIAHAMYADYVDPSGNMTTVTTTGGTNAQVIFTGNDFVTVHQHSLRGTNPYDGLCIYSQRQCYTFPNSLNNTPLGIVIDGASNLWVAESGDSAILEVPVIDVSTGNGTGYLNSSSQLPYNEYLHGSSYGGTMTKPTGIGVDATGNVWVSNATCAGSTCTGGSPSNSFILTEVVGAAAPTITPVSAQITGSNNLVGTKPTH